MSDKIRYVEASHAMQTGVAIKMQYDPDETSPKHLRVGVNAAMRDLGSIVHLLVEKGLLTMEEVEAALADGMEEEARSYEVELTRMLGKKVRLG